MSRYEELRALAEKAQRTSAYDEDWVAFAARVQEFPALFLALLDERERLLKGAYQTAAYCEARITSDDPDIGWRSVYTFVRDLAPIERER